MTYSSFFFYHFPDVPKREGEIYMKNKGKTRRIKMAAWTAFMLPLIGLLSNGIEIPPEGEVNEVAYHEEEVQYCATGPTTFFSGYAAMDANYFEQPKFVINYFNNLDLNMPTNNVGNCGYVGLTMLLSYYDTYWNGDIIPDIYNNPDETVISALDDPIYDSPGVTDFHADLFLDEEMPEPNEKSEPDYIDKYDEMEREAYSHYLDQMFGHVSDTLISKFYELALNRSQHWKYPIWDFQQKRNRKPSINVVGLQELTNRFFIDMGLLNGEAALETKRIYDYPQFSDIQDKRNALRNDAIEKLMHGQPILFQGTLSDDSKKEDPNARNNGGGGHIAVAYAYDEWTGYIIGHMGWKGTGTRMVPLDKAFETFDAFAFLDIKDTMEFTPKNYRFQWRGDRHAVDLYSHIHADELHRAKIDYGDSNYHALQCVCGDVCYEEHVFDKLVTLGQHTHAYECSCGAHSAPQAHVYDEIEMIDEHNHALKCDCGDVTYEGHVYDDVKRIDAQTHKAQCACGSVIYEPHTEDRTVYFNGDLHAYKCRRGEIVGFGSHFYYQRSLTESVCFLCGHVKHTKPPFMLEL